jgi:hypothetical protein
MQKLFSRSLALIAITAGALGLAACGSSNNAESLISGTDLPQTITTQPARVISFANSTQAATSDSAEPLAVGDAVLATSETDEPDPSV